ncbi:MAG: zf-HC2 domain-containing protein [Solirubrobacterales bacterium]
MAATPWRRLNADRDHRWARPRLSAYIEDELPARQRRRLAAHEELCPDCARMVATLDALLRILPSLSLAPNAALGVAEETAERVGARIEEWA